MSATDNGSESTTGNCCASCGKAESDDVKLEDCDKCDLAQYCGDKCQQEHRPEHRVICTLRVLRAAQLRDKILFKQPEETHLGDCPICCLPLSFGLNKFGENKYTFYTCCSKIICDGCICANLNREIRQRLEEKCPFCRQEIEKNEEEGAERHMERAEANDPVSLHRIGSMHYKEGTYDKAFEYWTRAAELGNAMAHHDLSRMYEEGVGVEKNEERWVYHVEEAAIAGHPLARYNLGVYEGRNGRIYRAVKHFIIAANQGDDSSLQALKEWYKEGLVSKDDFAAALRSHQAAVDATKSPQREAAEFYAGFFQKGTSLDTLKSLKENPTLRWKLSCLLNK